jgi:F-type H+-transporting ATPase subunit alpha
MSYPIIEKLKKEIAGHREEIREEKIGTVTQVGDGIVSISGLRQAMSQELLLIQSQDGDRAAVALNLEEETIGALALEDYKAIKAGDVVKQTGRLLSIPVGDTLLGRVINPLGEPIDGKGPLLSSKSDSTSPGKNPEEAHYATLERNAPSVLDRESVNRPIHTGVKAIDGMIPIGRGQRELIIGDRQTGKTAIALDTIINQVHEANRPVCIYVAIGQKESKTAKIVEILKSSGALDKTIVVVAAASDPASLWYLAPLAGCAIGEYFRDRGEDALVIYDDLSKHAWAYRQISLLLRRPPGREAYPGDIFYLHSRLLERAAKLSKEKGGGSLTALPIIETQLGDVSAYIPTNVISITDGQIYLESDLFYQGQRPAVNVGLSVSRVGSSAQTKAMKKVAGRLRLALAQFRELQAFVQFAADVDEETKKRIRHGQIMNEVLKQDDLSPLPFEEQVVLFYAAVNDYFDQHEPSQMRAISERFLQYFKQFHSADILKVLKEKEILDPETEEKIKKAITAFQNHNK